MVVCLSNTGYEVSLEPRKIYKALQDAAAAKHDELRVIDESGEDYLFPASLFAPIVLRGEGEACDSRRRLGGGTRGQHGVRAAAATPTTAF